MGRARTPAQPVVVAPKHRSNPLLLKPARRGTWEAVPSALHIAGAVTLTTLVFAITNIIVTMTHSPRNPFVKLVQTGTMMAMITANILATPTLGTSVTKAIARIFGVMMGGWLFFGLYAANQAWWFLTLCLAAWAFIMVALSFLLSGQQFLSPVAVVTAFIVACSFNSVKQALVMTVVKTVAISGSIFLYTLLAMALFPASATQQLLRHLAIAIEDLHKLAAIVLLNGEGGEDAAGGAGDNGEQATAAAAADAEGGLGGSGSSPAGKDLEAPASKKDDAAAVGLVGAAVSRHLPAASKSRKAAAAAAAAAAANSVAVGLAADAGHRLQMVQELLPASTKERFAGSCGTYRCFLPGVRRVGVLKEADVLAVVLNASQVLRVLVSAMSELGSVPMSQRGAPERLLGKEGQQLLAPLAQHAVDSLNDISAALPVTGQPRGGVPLVNIRSYSDVLQQLIAATVKQQQAPLPAGDAAAAAGGTGAAPPADGNAAARSDGAAGGIARRWQQAAVAGGAKLPQQGAGRPEQLAAAFGALLSDAVTSEQGQIARWCSLLVLARQTGRAIAGLNDSANTLLTALPWAGTKHA